MSEEDGAGDDRLRPGGARDKDGTPMRNFSEADRKRWAEATYSRFSESFKKAGGMDRAAFVRTAAQASPEEFAELRRGYDAAGRRR